MLHTRVALAAALLAGSVMLSGCSGGPGSQAPGAAPGPLAGIALDGVYDVAQTPDVEGEEMGFMRVAFRQGAFALDNEREAALPHHAYVADGVVHTSRTLMGWTSQGAAEAARGQDLRLAIWNLPDVLGDGAEVEVAGDRFHATRELDVGGRAVRVEVDATLEGGRLARATVRSAEGIEDPYTFTPAAAPLRFPMGPPQPSRAAHAIADGDAAATAGHGTLRALVQSYCRSHGGLVPDSVDPDTLRLDMLATGSSWPASPYDSAPLHDADEQGHFLWQKTAPNRGRYVGIGWDGPIVVHDFSPAVCGP